MFPHKKGESDICEKKKKCIYISAVLSIFLTNKKKIEYLMVLACSMDHCTSLMGGP